MLAILGSTITRVKEELRARAHLPSTLFSVVASRAAAPRPGVMAAAHPEVLLLSDANAASSTRIGRNLLHADAKHAKSAACKSEVVACSITCFLFPLLKGFRGEMGCNGFQILVLKRQICEICICFSRVL